MQKAHIDRISGGGGCQLAVRVSISDLDLRSKAKELKSKPCQKTR